MHDRNELIRLVRNIIGEEKEDGFYTSVSWNNNIIEVPNFLFKDGPAEYPEIRISPFLVDRQKSHSIRVRRYDYDRKTKFYDTIFQVDIYATNIVLVNKIFDAVKRRIGLFYDIDTVFYGYDEAFQLIDEEKNIYYSQKYNNKDFDIISIQFCRQLIQRVYDKKQLMKNTYYIDKTGLYIRTDFPIKRIKINTVLNGLIFADGHTAHQKGIIKTKIRNVKNLSELENNDVERISFELGIFYRMDSMRNAGPLATHITIDSD